VTLGYVPYSDDASLFYAQSSGIFKKHGLNVTFVAQASPVAVEASMASGTEQFGFITTPVLINLNSKGVSVKCVSSVDGGEPSNPANDSTVLVAAKGSGIKSVKDLAGKNVAEVQLTSLNSLAVEILAKQAGIDPKSIHQVAIPFPQMSAALAQGRVQAAVIVAPFAASALSEGATVLQLADHEIPAASDVVAVLAGTQASHVTVLPNSDELGEVLAAAVTEVVLAGQDVLVVPTLSPVQGLAALAVHDPARRPGDDVVAMAEAAAATRRGELTVATEQGITWVGVCQPGDVLGLLDGEIVLIEPGPATEPLVIGAARKLVDRMLAGGGELVTALPGADAPESLVDDLTEHVRAEHREVELTGYPGGQAEAILLLGVE